MVAPVHQSLEQLPLPPDPRRPRWMALLRDGNATLSERESCADAIACPKWYRFWESGRVRP
jgi:hypothetical protein